MTTQNLAIMSTDVVGSTPTTASLDRAEYKRFRDDYDRVVKSILEAGAATIFKELGDGFLASFHSSTDAVLTGLRIEEQIRSNIASLRWDERFATRIGISSGDVSVEGGDCFGVPVILATRVQSIAEPLTTCFTDSVFHTMNRNEVDYDELGAISLKGLEDAVRLYRARPRGTPPAVETCAVLLVDTRGFTTMAESGDETLEESFALYDELVFSYALRFGGRLRYNVTDQYYFTFSEVAAALEAARAIIGDPDGIRSRYELAQVRVCAALHVGRLRIVAGRYLGSAISRIVPRIIGVAKADDIIATAEFADQLARRAPELSAAVESEPLPPIMVKGSADALALVRYRP